MNNSIVSTQIALARALSSWQDSEWLRTHLEHGKPIDGSIESRRYFDKRTADEIIRNYKCG